MTKIFVGDLGTEVVLDCGADISAATARSISVLLPDGTETTWTAVASGSNAIKHVAAPTTFVQLGTYRLQAVVTLPSGTWRGETAKLKVYDKFK